MTLTMYVLMVNDNVNIAVILLHLACHKSEAPVRAELGMAGNHE